MKIEPEYIINGNKYILDKKPSEPMRAREFYVSHGGLEYVLKLSNDLYYPAASKEKTSTTSVLMREVLPNTVTASREDFKKVWIEILHHRGHVDFGNFCAAFGLKEAP